ncbi:hypothetical protein ABZ719_11450 [Streptomyces sp. NPDC006743]|uniref:hypothetical protein n=1 Tax=Streptomyces sp. NPDC006743 TaxID=3154480 RepID=UPI0034528E0D
MSTQTIPFTVVVDPEGRAAAVRIGTTSQARTAEILTPLLPGTAKAAGGPEH